MKHLLKIILLAAVFSAMCGSTLFAQDDPQEQPAEEVSEPLPPRIVAMGESAPYAQTHIRTLDLSNGVIVYDWINSEGNKADGGNSITTFTPRLDAVDEDTDETIPATTLTDAEIVAAILAPDPPAAVPASVTPYQLWRALKAEFGLSRTQVLTAVNAITNADTKDAYLTAIETPQTYERADPTIVALGLMLSLSSDDLDTVFRAAARL